MYNNEVADILIARYGTEAFKIYCILEIEKNKLLAKDKKQVHPEEPVEYEYEAEFWKDRLKQLITKENH